MDPKLRAYLDELHDGFAPFANMAEVGVNSNGDGSPIQYAIVQNRLDMVVLLLEHGANPALQDSYGYTALDLAVEHRRAAMVPLLLAYGAKLQMIDEADLRLVEQEQQDGAGGACPD